MSCGTDGKRKKEKVCIFVYRKLPRKNCQDLLRLWMLYGKERAHEGNGKNISVFQLSAIAAGVQAFSCSALQPSQQAEEPDTCRDEKCKSKKESIDLNK